MRCGPGSFAYPGCVLEVVSLAPVRAWAVETSLRAGSTMLLFLCEPWLTTDGSLLKEAPRELN